MLEIILLNTSYHNLIKVDNVLCISYLLFSYGQQYSVIMEKLLNRRISLLVVEIM